MRAPRDLTAEQFADACSRRGFRRELLGYFDVGHGVAVSASNGGRTRREQLAYLIREAGKVEAMVERYGKPWNPEEIRRGRSATTRQARA